MVIEREIPIQPEDVENGLYPIANHGRIASKSKGDEALHILGQMRRPGYTDSLTLAWAEGV